MKNWSTWEKIQFILLIIVFTPLLLLIGYALAIVEVKNRVIKNLERREIVNGR
jgi:hypothetical protein